MMNISESKILYWISLAYIGANKQAKLLKLFNGSPMQIWDEFFVRKKEIQLVIGNKNYDILSRYRDVDYINMSLDKLRQDGIKVVTILNPIFPKLLLQPEVNPPAVLYYRGDLSVLEKTCIAVVGTRNPTSYGRECAKNIASQLANAGITVVSGLAMGIDAYAHEACLDVGGKTVAVLAGGLNKISPVSNTHLYERIISSGGLVISEHRPDYESMKFNFPERNRLVSGLCKGVVVVEAGEKSGALITARLALEQNREIFALPGNVTCSRSKGCNNLLFSGANFIRDGYDVLSFFNLKIEKKTINDLILVDKVQKKLYSFLESGPKTMDQLAELSLLSVAELSQHLVSMELLGVIDKPSANLYSIKKN